MGRTETKQERTPFPATQKVELRQPTITKDDHPSTTQQRTPPPTTRKIEPKRPAVSEDDVRLRAYELYLRRGATPGDEVGDWLQAERELQAN